MSQQGRDVARRSRLLRWFLRCAGNLLILVGVTLLGSSLVAATSAPDRWSRDEPRSITPATASIAASPTVDHQPGTPAAAVKRSATSTPIPQEAAPRQSTPIATDVIPPQPPRPGERLLEPDVIATKPTSPYVQNMTGERPIRITAPAVGIDTGIVEVEPVAVQAGQQTVFEWQVADWAAGHHSTSANPGEGGNIVIAGHGDVRGEVFRGLHDIKVGDQVTVSTNETDYTYVVHEIHLRRFTDEPLDELLSVGGFIGPMPEERLTLVTCWPYRVDTHRMIVVAKPAS